jgi:hypothetical protein
MTSNTLQAAGEACDPLFVDSFAKRANAALAAKGKNKQWLSKAAKLSQPTVSRLLNLYSTKKKRPSADVVAKLASALDVSSEWLVGASNVTGATGDAALAFGAVQSEAEAVIQSAEWPATLTGTQVIEILAEFREEASLPGLPRAYLAARLKKLIAERL